jgi:hypothetical protein
MFALNALTNLLPAGLRPLAKACWPAIATLVAVAVQWIATGEFDRSELVTAITGLCAALLTYWVPNVPQVTGTTVPTETRVA